ncbi:MAG: hypothetical protein R2867_10320 [Caldilineaceae bacterium]
MAALTRNEHNGAQGGIAKMVTMAPSCNQRPPPLPSRSRIALTISKIAPPLSYGDAPSTIQSCKATGHALHRYADRIEIAQGGENEQDFDIERSQHR